MSNEINIEELERLAKDLIHSAPWTDLHKDQTIAFEVTVTPNAILSLIDRMKKAESELERERMRLAACGVVAMADTPESAAEAREMRDEYRSASCDDVARRVDECMTLRAERDALAAMLSAAQGMADCMEMLRSEMIDAGVIDASVAPMFFPESIIPRLRLLDVAVWPAGYCRDPNGKMSIPAGKEEDFNFGYDVGFQEAWEIMNSAISAEGKSPTSQQEHLLQDMHDAGREIDRVMAVDAETVDRAWARFCGAFGDGPDAPYPGMIAAFETHYGQSFRDKEWRTEAACWAAAWSKATARAEASLAEPQLDADGPWKSTVIDQLVIAHILTAEHESDPLKAVQDLLAYHADIAVDPRVSGAAAKLVEQAKAEEREACAHKGWMAASWDCEDRVKAAILARGQK